MHLNIKTIIHSHNLSMEEKTLVFMSPCMHAV